MSSIKSVFTYCSSRKHPHDSFKVRIIDLDASVSKSINEGIKDAAVIDELSLDNILTIIQTYKTYKFEVGILDRLSYCNDRYVEFFWKSYNSFEMEQKSGIL